MLHFQLLVQALVGSGVSLRLQRSHQLANGVCLKQGQTNVIYPRNIDCLLLMSQEINPIAGKTSRSPQRGQLVSSFLMLL